MKGRDLITLQDYSRDEIISILKLAMEFKSGKANRLLPNKSLAMIFQKPSTRTSHQA
jgi:ornithine carbamoyltransferase